VWVAVQKTKTRREIVKKIIIGAMVLMVAMSVRATLVVDFTVTNAVNISSRAANSDTVSGDTWNFSDTTKLINAAATNGNIYGGLITTWSPDKTYAPIVRQNLTNLQVLVSSSGTNSDNTCKGMFVWKKEDFISGGSSMQLGFNPGDALSVNMVAAGDTRSVRLVVAQAGQYYVSAANWAPAATYLNFTTNATQTTWAPISTNDYSIGTFAALNVTNIQAVGVYFNMERAGNQAIFSVSDFQVNATAIPEPATLGLFVIAGGMVMFMRKLHTVR
jgi:hypothetical protein